MKHAAFLRAVLRTIIAIATEPTPVGDPGGQCFTVGSRRRCEVPQ